MEVLRNKDLDDTTKTELAIEMLAKLCGEEPALQNNVEEWMDVFADTCYGDDLPHGLGEWERGHCGTEREHDIDLLAFFMARKRWAQEKQKRQQDRTAENKPKTKKRKSTSV